MSRMTAKILFFALFLCTQMSFAHADQKWVSITLFTAPGKDTTGEYFGSIDSAVLDQINRGRDDKGMFQLSSVYWYDNDGKVVQMKDLATLHGVKYGYSNLMYFRQDGIDRITLLDKDYVENMMKGAGKP